MGLLNVILQMQLQGGERYRFLIKVLVLSGGLAFGVGDRSHCYPGSLLLPAQPGSLYFCEFSLFFSFTLMEAG